MKCLSGGSYVLYTVIYKIEKLVKIDSTTASQNVRMYKLMCKTTSNGSQCLLCIPFMERENNVLWLNFEVI